MRRVSNGCEARGECNVLIPGLKDLLLVVRAATMHESALYPPLPHRLLRNETHCIRARQVSTGCDGSTPVTSYQAGLTEMNVPSSSWRERPTAQVSERMASSVWSWASRRSEADSIALCLLMLRGRGVSFAPNQADSTNSMRQTHLVNTPK